jgi:hypothetical protein
MFAKILQTETELFDAGGRAVGMTHLVAFLNFVNVSKNK